MWILHYDNGPDTELKTAKKGEPRAMILLKRKLKAQHPGRRYWLSPCKNTVAVASKR